MKGKKISKKPFGKDAFEYDWGNDEYICPAGERVTFRYEFFEKSTNNLGDNHWFLYRPNIRT